MSQDQSESTKRRLKFEEFEQRLVMSAQAVGSILPELDVAAPAITQQEVTLDNASSENAHTQAAGVAAEYGFDGAGQTVAVIDSGIAWDHYALGGAFGEGAKVVGGWDFAENDANPYDDGPAGYHGTHVAGIIGSTDDTYRGVSSGVDLVALRVFGDRGEGELEWVEQALQWVHENKDSFENPITTVNLSLGTNWNAENSPEWAILEDEFAKLEADGLFISVAAGNSFKSFGEAGLSYPAVSEHVVPVASHDAEGQISDFSQRDEGVLVAPGELLRSTAPDHLFFGSSTNDFVGSTGTSMSAPYVAGASAVLRQANEFMGVENVTQDMLYQQFMDTADQIYDSVTSQYYYRVNLEAALESVVSDRHLEETATEIGTVNGGEIIEGTIGKISDVDSFSFTANQSGTVTLDMSVTDDLAPLVDVAGVNTSINGNKISFDVVKGQTYEFAIATADGNGHYQIKMDLDAAKETNQGEVNVPTGNTGSSFTNWGTVVSGEILNQQVNGDASYQVTAARDGFLTVQIDANTNGTGTVFRTEVYDQQNNLVASDSSTSGQLRFDIDAKGGESFVIKTIGQSDNVDFRIDNLVTESNGELIINGTNREDTFVFDASNGIAFNVNGVDYQFDASRISNVTVVGHQSNDRIELTLGDENDRVWTRETGVNFVNESMTFLAFDIRNVTVDAGGGYDVVSMEDSAGNDVFRSNHTNKGADASYTGGGFSSEARGFDVVYAVGTGGDDQAFLNGSSGDDLFVARGSLNTIWAGNTTVMADHFESTTIDGIGGSDTANVYDSSGDDQLVLTPGAGSLENSEYSIQWSNISRTNAFSSQGNDSATLYDSAGNDTLYSANGMNVLSGDGFMSYAEGFDHVEVIASTGVDFGQVHDTAGNDRFYSEAGSTRMESDSSIVETRGFKAVNLISKNGGYDRATVVGTDSADVLTADIDSINVVNSNGLANRLVGMDETSVDLGGGIDFAYLVGSSGKEVLTGDYDEVEFETTLQLLRMTNAEHTEFDGNGGGDEVQLQEFKALDLLETLGDKAVAYLQDHTISVEGIDLLEAKTVENAIAGYDLDKVDFSYMLRGKWAKS